MSEIILSHREQQILLLTAKGLMARQISDEIGVSSQTVAHYLEKLRGYFEVDSNPALVAQAFVHGWLAGEQGQVRLAKGI